MRRYSLDQFHLGKPQCENKNHKRKAYFPMRSLISVYAYERSICMLHITQIAVICCLCSVANERTFCLNIKSSLANRECTLVIRWAFFAVMGIRPYVHMVRGIVRSAVGLPCSAKFSSPQPWSRTPKPTWLRVHHTKSSV
jgi:hypothetical protein